MFKIKFLFITFGITLVQFSKGMLSIMLTDTVILDLHSFSCYDDRHLVL